MYVCVYVNTRSTNMLCMFLFNIFVHTHTHTYIHLQITLNVHVCTVSIATCNSPEHAHPQSRKRITTRNSREHVYTQSRKRIPICKSGEHVYTQYVYPHSRKRIPICNSASVSPYVKVVNMPTHNHASLTRNSHEIPYTSKKKNLIIYPVLQQVYHSTKFCHKIN